MNNNASAGFKIKFLTDTLNRYSEAYYNGVPIASDQKYDELYEQLKTLEKETGIVMSASPINKVGYQIRGNIAKMTHASPMLSLDKIHSYEEIVSFMKRQGCIASLKEDGMTCRLTYNINGELIRAESRGDGEVGQDILSVVKESLLNVPITIGCHNALVIDGEIICKYDDFEIANANEEYTIPRALVSGAMSALNTKEIREKRLSFVAWRVVSGLLESNTMTDDFVTLEKLGFTVVPYDVIFSDSVEMTIKALMETANNVHHPIDGIVISYNDKYYNTEKTSHHFKHSIAYKPEQEKKETTLRFVDWQVGRTGVLTPVAIFDPVILDNTTVTRATLHNISYVRNLKLGIGDTIVITKFNQIIPGVCDNKTKRNTLEVPNICPYCGEETTISTTNSTITVKCTNNECIGQKIGMFTHFVSRKGMNINGLSTGIIDVLVKKKLVTKFYDFYTLKSHEEELKSMDRFGDKSVDNLLKSIQDSKKVNLSNFIVSLGIPLVGTGVAKIIAKEAKYDFDLFAIACDTAYDWSRLEGIGKKIAKEINLYWQYNRHDIMELVDIMDIQKEEVPTVKPSPFEGKTVVVTGKLEKFTRETINEKIESLGAKTASSVSKKTDYLLTNEKDSGSSKAKKAIELNIPIISEDEFLYIVGE